jgi:hypothetical protein
VTHKELKNFALAYANNTSSDYVARFIAQGYLDLYAKVEAAYIEIESAHAWIETHEKCHQPVSIPTLLKL